MTIPQLDARPFKDLCGSGFRPRRLTGILQLWLVQHFASTNNIVEKGVKQRVWTPDPNTSKIQILPISDWRPKNTEQRPALLIKRQELKFTREGIDNRLMGGFGTRQLFAAIMQGSHTVFCVAGEAGEAEELAAEVSQEFMKFSHAVRVWLDLLRIELTGIGEVAKLEEASENFVVPVNIAYSYLEKWEILALDDPTLVRITSVINS
jgi:hypothetical protein